MCTDHNSRHAFLQNILLVDVKLNPPVSLRKCNLVVTVNLQSRARQDNISMQQLLERTDDVQSTNLPRIYTLATNLTNRPKTIRTWEIVSARSLHHYGKRTRCRRPEAGCRWRLPVGVPLPSSAYPNPVGVRGVGPTKRHPTVSVSAPYADGIAVGL